MKLLLLFARIKEFDHRDGTKNQRDHGDLFVSKRGRVKSKGDRDLLPSRNIRLSLQED